MTIPTGKTIESGTVRVHRFADHFRVTDLTNAGKRGKRVRSASFAPTFYFKGDHGAWLENMAGILPSLDSFDAVKRLVADVRADYPLEVTFDESEQRGVDVAPAGAQTIRLVTAGGLEITASAGGFMVKSTQVLGGSKGHKQDTLYWPAGTKTAQRASSAAFFAWLRSNLSTVEAMTIGELRAQWEALGVGYDHH